MSTRRDFLKKCGYLVGTSLVLTSTLKEVRADIDVPVLPLDTPTRYTRMLHFTVNYDAFIGLIDNEKELSIEELETHEAALMNRLGFDPSACYISVRQISWNQPLNHVSVENEDGTLSDAVIAMPTTITIDFILFTKDDKAVENALKAISERNDPTKLNFVDISLAGSLPLKPVTKRDIEMNIKVYRQAFPLLDSGIRDTCHADPNKLEARITLP
jgi:hypothetical protein